MKINKIKKTLATAIVISTSTTLFPITTIVMADTDNATVSDIATTYKDNSTITSNISSTTSPAVSYTMETESNHSTTAASVYYNDFENDRLPDKVNWNTDLSSVATEDLNGNKALRFNVNFDSASTWSNETSFCFFTSSSEIKAGSEIKFDILIPKKDADGCNGDIKFEGLLQGDWSDKGKGDGLVSLSDLEEQGDYLRKTVSVKTDVDTKNLTNLVLKIAGGNSDYKGEIYIDNIELIANGAQDDSVVPKNSNLEWSFDKDISGWSYGGAYEYTGSTENVVNYDSIVGNGAMKLDVDYSNSASVAWSEFKISKDLGATNSFNGYKYLTYDFIYDPSKMTTGGFQTKLFITDKLNTYGTINLKNSVDIGNGLKKVNVFLKFDSQDANANLITIGIVGSNTDYKGSIYVDNIKLTKEIPEGIYVEKTSVADNSQTKVSIDKIDMPSKVKLVDSNSIKETANLYAYLKGVGKSQYVLYGHQNDTNYKAGIGPTNSDTKDVTGSIAAVCGNDALSLTGFELELTDEDKANGVDLISKAAQLGVDVSKEGGIVTLSAHMPNFELVKEKGRGADGKYDYSGYTPIITTGNIVSRIIPGGDLNEVYTEYLDMIAEYAHKLEASGVPVLFRPFHENNGSWFWWGKAFCSEEAYKNMYRYTVEYLRDACSVHNFLYVYSPNGTFQDEADYLSRYPGDEFVDVLAFDMYDDAPTADVATDPWMKSLKNTIKLVQGIADKKGKLSAVSETGIRVVNDALALSGNVDKNWFSEVSNIISGSNMPYYMVWANFSEERGFYSPYMVSDTKGHEMVNKFIDYYNEEESVFANGVGKYSDANTEIDSPYVYGFIIDPDKNSRILEPTKITASERGYSGQIKFILKNNKDESVETLNATLNNGIYEANITQDVLNKIGKTIGSIDLYSDDTKLDTKKVIFNIKEQEKNPKVVDDFESYMGDNDILENNWTVNSGAGCSITPKLYGNSRYSGEYGLAFNYKITPGGWAGITKALDVDWSDSNALQIWIKPDGKGQKLVIQLTSNGEDFEVDMPEFSATTEAKLLTIPFNEFKGKNNGIFDPAHIQKMGIWCNTIGSDNVDSVMYFDNIMAVNSNNSRNSSLGNSSNGNSSSSNQNSSNSEVNANSSQITISKNKWIKENDYWKYVDENGLKLADTWKQIDGQWYYFNQDSTMKTGWLQDKDSNWYFLQSDGSMKTDWIKGDDGNWYYLQSNGAMKIGWLLDKDNNWYYLQNNGAMKIGWFEDNDGKWYYLKTNGTMAKNEYINGYLLGENGYWMI
ncbi:glycosyl hydrolase [Clostridium chromiireducens]|uniref:glycosyl hydrolase n=1 Tax=Clostridium chromiireducens TaxID=225345 RepID=UPI003AF9CA0C